MSPRLDRLPAPTEDQIDAAICAKSFWEFTKMFWEVAVPEAPMKYNWHMEFLCNELQAMAERVFAGLPKLHDLIVNISPGTSKSTIFSILFPAWVWTRMPAARVITASYKHGLALDFGRKSRDVCRSAKYKTYWPHIDFRRDQDTKEYYVNTQGGMRLSNGVGGGVTGYHGHFIIVDDPQNPKKASSEQERITANQWMSETIQSRKTDKAVTPMITVMQRLHENDCTGHLLESNPDGNRHICLPATLSDDVKPPECRQYYVDGYMDPVRLSQLILNEAFKQLADYGYSGQYMQTPKPRGGGMFNITKLHYEDALPLPARIRRTVRYWDKAGTEETASNDPAWTVGLKMLEELDAEGKPYRWWITDVIRGRWASDERAKQERQTANMDGRKVIVGMEQEPGSGGKESAEASVRRLRGYRVRVDRPTGDKATRADPLSVQVNWGNFVLLRAPWNAVFVSEMSMFPRSRYKDQVDAASGAFSMLTRPKRVGAL